MSGEIGWRFPPTNGGAGDGFNDSGIAHFKGSPMPNLARETIQNSLDARMVDAEPVHVSFELISLDRAVEFGRNELGRAITACRNSPDCKDLAESELEAAQEALEANTVQSLCVSDRNTTGLQDENWRALVKTRGLSIKSGKEQAGRTGLVRPRPLQLPLCERCSTGPITGQATSLMNGFKVNRC